MTLPPALVADTSVISLPLKEREPTRLKAYQSLLEGSVVILSFMTVAEIGQWAEVRNWGERKRDEWRRRLADCVVIHSDAELCANWARLMGLSKRGGHNLGHADAWIAATALARDTPLVSDNVRHFA